MWYGLFQGKYHFKSNNLSALSLSFLEIISIALVKFKRTETMMIKQKMGKQRNSIIG
jgi:hypothetical protein